MKVKEARQKLNELKSLANNTRLIEQYFLQCSDMKLEKIEKKYDINSPINIVMNSAVNELMAVYEKFEHVIDETEIMIEC